MSCLALLLHMTLLSASRLACLHFWSGLHGVVEYLWALLCAYMLFCTCVYMPLLVAMRFHVYTAIHCPVERCLFTIHLYHYMVHAPTCAVPSETKLIC